MKDLRSSLTVVNARPEFERAAVWLGEFCMQAALPKAFTAKLQVALDEVLSNIVNHAFAGASEGEREISLRVRLGKGKVELEVVDDGPLFDPTRSEPVPKDMPVAQRPEGGLGLLFVRSLVDEARFFRKGNYNHLILGKRLGGTD